MRRAAYMLGLIAMVSVALWMVGCGGVELLDTFGQKYLADITAVNDTGSIGGTSSSSEIDIYQNPDCDGNGTAEPWFNVAGTVTISSSASPNTAPGVTFTRYVVEYIPQPSPDGTGGTFDPPNLVSISNNQTIRVEGNGGSTEEIAILLMTTNSKDEYLAAMTALYGPGNAIDYNGLYTIRVTFYGTDDEGNSVTLSVDEDVELSGFDYCPA